MIVAKNGIMSVQVYAWSASVVIVQSFVSVTKVAVAFLSKVK